MSAETPETAAVRPFTAGDRVLAGTRMVGCETHWWEGEGVVESIAPAEVHDGLLVPPIAFVRWDGLVSAPCTHDRWNSRAPMGGTTIPLTADHTAPAHPASMRLVLVEPASDAAALSGAPAVE